VLPPKPISIFSPDNYRNSSQCHRLHFIFSSTSTRFSPHDDFNTAKMALSPFWKAYIYSFTFFFIIFAFYITAIATEMRESGGSSDAPYILKAIACFSIIVLTPIFLFIGPLQIGTSVRVWKHEWWPQKKSWQIVTVCWAYNALSRVYLNAEEFYKGRAKCGGVMLCGFGECAAV